MSKFRILCIAAACALSANAASPMKKMPAGPTGWGVGSHIISTGEEANGGVTLDYKSENYEFGFLGAARFNKKEITTGIVNPTTEDERWSEFSVGGYLGARNRLQKDFAVSSGAEVRALLCDKWSAYGLGVTPMRTVPYAVSFYSQLSHEHRNHSVYARLALISYEEFGNTTLGSEVNVASNVMIGLNYYFQM